MQVQKVIVNPDMFYQRQQALIKGPGPVRVYEQTAIPKFDVMVTSNSNQAQQLTRQKQR